METPRDGLKQENKQQIGQLVSGMANISMSNEEKEGKMLTLSVIYSKEEELMKKNMEVWEKVKAHLRRVEDDAKQLAEICREFGALENPVRKEVVASVCDKDWVNIEYKSLAWSCLKKEKKYREALEALETFSDLNQARNESNKEKVESKTKLLEMVNETAVVTNDQERSELISASSENEIEKKKEDADHSTMNEPRKTRRNVQKPERFEHAADHIKKGKGRSKKRV